MRAFVANSRAAVQRAILSRYFVPGCVGIAALLRFAWVLAAPAEPLSDFHWYWTHALSVASGQGYADGGVPTAYFPPGYPFFLAGLLKLFGPSLLVAKCASILLQCGAVVLAYLAARTLFRSELTGRLTLLLLAFHPNNISYSSLLASEHLFVFLMLLGAVLLLTAKERAWLLVVTGIVWGLAALTRPQAVFIPLIFFLLLAIKNHAWRAPLRSALIVHLLLGMTLAPWLWRNYLAFRHPVMTTTTGINLFMGNNPEAIGAYIFTDRMYAMLPTPYDTEYAFDAACRTAATAYIREYPLQVLALLPRKLFHLYHTDFDAIDWNIAGTEYTKPALTAWLASLRPLQQYYYTFLVLLFCAVLVSARVRRRIALLSGSFPTFGLWIIVCFTLLYLVYYGMPRYHIPMIPWIAMYAAAVLAMLWQSAVSRRTVEHHAPVECTPTAG